MNMRDYLIDFGGEGLMVDTNPPPPFSPPQPSPTLQNPENALFSWRGGKNTWGGDVETWHLVKDVVAYVLDTSCKIFKISAKIIEFSSKNEMFNNQL